MRLVAKEIFVPVYCLRESKLSAKTGEAPFTVMSRCPLLTSGMDPPLRDLFFQRDATRRSVIASYWLVIILALPLWWHTTTINRLSLPSSRVEAIAHNELLIPINICLVTNDHSLPEKLRYHLGRSTDYWKVLDVHIFGDSDCSSLGMFYCVLMIRF